MLLVLILSYLDISFHWNKPNAKSIASVTTQRVSSQQYTLILEIPNKIPLHFEMSGDMWQLDARLLLWDRYWSYLGLENLYRFDRLSGRYQSVKDEMQQRRTIYQLWRPELESESGWFSVFDNFKTWLSAYSWLPGTHLLYGGSVYVPMKDDARFELFFEGRSLQVRAQNDEARNALIEWQ